MATITNFNDWLDDNVDGNDYNDVYSIYHAVSEESDFGGFEVSKNSSGRLFVSGPGEDTLMISTEKAIETFLKTIESRYCDEMDIEGYYYFHHAMEKDD